MELAKAIARAKAFATDELGLTPTAIGALPKGEGYCVLLEAVVEAEYMRQRAQRDLVAIFEVTVDTELNVAAFERKEVRERGKTTGQG